MLKRIYLMAFILGASLECFAQKQGIKDYYQAYFPIGVAVNQTVLSSDPESKLIIKHFNSITPENAMKIEPIHPAENEYNWAPVDEILAFAKIHGMAMRGHTLCWHNQAPAWFFMKDGMKVSKAVLLERLKIHIGMIMSRYRGQIYAYDVVNEAVSDAGTEMLRPSPFLEIIGEEYIAKAFEYAHTADPTAQLFYNDYNTENPQKREKIYQLLKGLLAKGVPIHGVGLQGHWSIYEPSYQALEESIKKFSSLGLKIQITEMDISIFQKEHDSRPKNAKDKLVLTDALLQKQAEHYGKIFEILRKYKTSITGVTFWNVSDKHSWLDNFPVKGRKDYPLLFDENFNPKPAYFKVIEWKK
ncbi:endo-1,4-beta-xylanase [Flectobacillus sp. DC10W]|uniref:Beta-xylanase n=1 Tax=Flectobacillus longus TaxID=2984207 RepID=A0ABT6YTC7_9BACT|nr:endo-1,4-beta-xylanase [Flectobacillus longus]MDI9866785.1 endo-1,4-beta-xylanase [Flectobacillus longus]